jgi:hypothetical protein
VVYGGSIPALPRVYRLFNLLDSSRIASSSRL